MEALHISSAESAPQGKTEPQEIHNNPAAVDKARRNLQQMGRYVRQGDVLFKLGMSLAVAFVTATVIVLSGIYAERLAEVIAVRACIGFFSSGVVVFLAALWLDDVGIPLYVSRHAELHQVWLSEAEGEEHTFESREEEREETQDESRQDLEPELSDTIPAEGESSFAPLDDSVRHMHTAE